MSGEGNVDMESPATQEGSAKGHDILGHENGSSDDLTDHLGDGTHAGHQRTASGNVIDTAAPIESVREAVSKFGGMTDWKAQKAVDEEKRRIVENKLDKVEMELPRYKKRAEDAREAKEKALSELDSTKRLIEELKLNLERVQTEEQQAKQDSELAKLRVEEVQQGIGDEASVATNTEFEVAQARHAAAVSELKTVKAELEKVRGDYASLVVEKDEAVKRAEEAAAASMEVEKTVEALTVELIEVKGSLESAHASHLEAEEQRIRAEMARAEDSSDLDKELKQAEEELEKLSQKHLPEKEIQLKLDEATALLLNLKQELKSYKERNESDPEEQIASYKRDLDEMRIKIQNATDEIDCLKIASASIESELEREKSEFSTTKAREGAASETVASLEAELEKIMSELDLIRLENVAGEPHELNQATKETEQSKSLELLANAEMSKAKEDKEVLEAHVLTIERRLQAVQKEIEASRASERLALEAIKSLEESELVGENAKGVTLSSEEYQALSKRAQDVEDQAKVKIAAAVSQIEEAKQSEERSLERLEEVNKEKAAKQDELKNAIENGDKAEEEKLEMEQELRQLKTESDLRRASDVSVQASDLCGSPTSSGLERRATVPEALLNNGVETDSSSEPEALKKKRRRRSLFPRIVMFLARTKVQTPRSTG